MASLRQSLRTLAGAATQTGVRPASADVGVARLQEPMWQAQRRWMAGGHGGHGHDVTYQGLSLHPASATHRNLAKGFGGLMWFWIFYRFYNDYDTFLFGHAQHFDHEDHEEHSHGSSKGHH